MPHQQLFRKGTRQQAMADALASQAMTPTQRPQGRIAANTGLADALTTVMTGLASRRANKKAEATLGQAEEERRKAQVAALSGFANPPNLVETQAAQNPFSRAQAAAEADVDPNIIGAYMQQKMGGSGADPNSVKEYEYAKRNGFDGSFQDWITAGGQSSRPSLVQEWEFYNALPEDQKPLYLEMKRNPNMSVQQVGGAPAVVDPSRVGGASVTPLSTPGQENQAAADKAAATTRATETTKVNVEALADLPRVEQNASQAVQAIDSLLSHPGFSGIFGKSGFMQPHLVPGSDWADANALLDQIKGKTFLEAYQTLKGGGQITEIEGTKAEQAIARLSRAQSDEAAQLALLELKEIAQLGVERARRRAGVAERTPYNPESSTDKTVSWNDL